MGGGKSVICSIEACENQVLARGWCRAHYRRWQRHGDPRGSGDRNPSTDPFIRFTRKYVVDPDTDCWNWTASRHRDGYGWFGPGGRGRLILAHRWSYERFVGPVPQGLYVLHRCDNPGCVNPDHLFVGTQQDNVDDCIRKGRRSHQRVRRELFPELA